MTITLESLKNASYLETVFADFDGKIDAAFVKNLRDKLGLTQYVFAKMLHVSKKTIEKWEQGGNPVKGGDAALLFLLDKHPEYARELLQIIPHNMIAPSQFAFLVDYTKTIKIDFGPSPSAETYKPTMDYKKDSWGTRDYYA